MIVLKSYYSYRRIFFYCYSNSSSSSVGHLRFPRNGYTYYSGSPYNVYIDRVNPSGIQVYVNRYSSPSYYGIYTCELPDAEGNIIYTAIGIYDSLRVLTVHSCSYNDMTQSNTDITLLGTIVCITSNSPPTNISWARDGIPIDIDGEKYDMTQSVTDRYSSYYSTTLLIRSAVHLAGNHTYSFFVSNSAGKGTEDILTYMEGKYEWNVHKLYFS